MRRRLKAATTTSQTSSASVASQTTAPDASPTTSTDSTPTPNHSQLPLPLHTPAPDAHQPTSPVSSTAPEINFPVLNTTPDAFETASPVSTTSPVSSTSRTTYPISTLPTSGTTASTSPTSRISTPYSPTASRTPSATPNRTPSPAIRFTPPPKSFTSFYSPSAAPKTPIPETLCATPISSSHSPLETTTATTTTSVGAALPAPKAQTTTPAVFVFSGKSTPSKVAAPLGSSPLPPRAVNPGASPPCKCEPPAGAKPTLDTRALAEASRNLTQTLKQLSSEVLTSRADPAEVTILVTWLPAALNVCRGVGDNVCFLLPGHSQSSQTRSHYRVHAPSRQGGLLWNLLSTIIHILNDLLCATPQYRRHARQAHTFTVEASSGSPPKQTTTTATVDKSPVASDESTEETNSLSLENQATRGKMEHLRLIMEERRARRRARREARVAPYTTQWSAKSESLSQAGTSHEPMDTDPSPSEQQLCELNPPEPVVA
uniref:Uncharacterized protein n=1 Tax=Timema tahoe TaxID=61484 RepID=A0A7R9IKW6_9NEOP|nr:unnamed protein product [Timema tahoe]